MEIFIGSVYSLDEVETMGTIKILVHNYDKQTHNSKKTNTNQYITYNVKDAVSDQGIDILDKQAHNCLLSSINGELYMPNIGDDILIVKVNTVKNDGSYVMNGKPGEKQNVVDQFIALPIQVHLPFQKNQKFVFPLPRNTYGSHQYGATPSVVASDHHFEYNGSFTSKGLEKITDLGRDSKLKQGQIKKMTEELDGEDTFKGSPDDKNNVGASKGECYNYEKENGKDGMPTYVSKYVKKFFAFREQNKDKEWDGKGRITESKKGEKLGSIENLRPRFFEYLDDEYYIVEMLNELDWGPGEKPSIKTESDAGHDITHLHRYSQIFMPMKGGLSLRTYLNVDPSKGTKCFHLESYVGIASTKADSKHLPTKNVPIIAGKNGVHIGLIWPSCEKCQGIPIVDKFINDHDTYMPRTGDPCPADSGLYWDYRKPYTWQTNLVIKPGGAWGEVYLRGTKIVIDADELILNGTNRLHIHSDNLAEIYTGTHGGSGQVKILSGDVHFGSQGDIKNYAGGAFYVQDEKVMGLTSGYAGVLQPYLQDHKNPPHGASKADGCMYPGKGSLIAKINKKSPEFPNDV